MQRHVGGAGAVAVDDRRQQLHVGAENLGDGLLLGIAEFGKLLGHMGNRAMVLADLDALDGSAHPGGGGGVPGLRQCIGDPFGGRLHGTAVLGRRCGYPGQDRIDPAAREGPYCVLSADLAQLPNGSRGQVVVGVLELSPPAGCQPVAFGRPAPAGVLPGGGRLRLGIAVVDECIEMAADAGGGDSEFAADLRGGDRTGLEQQTHDRPPRRPVVRGHPVGHRRRNVVEFHNTSVTQFGNRIQEGHPHFPHLAAGIRSPSAPAVRVLRVAARQLSLSSSIASWHGDERTVGAPLNAPELRAMRRTRLFGATGTVLMGIGALGAGARPVVQDPTFGVRLLNLPSRIQTVSLTMTTTGAVMMALAWLMLGRFALGPRRMSRSQLDRTLLLWMVPLLIAPPMYSKDVYSYLAQSQIARLGLDPYKVGPAPGLGLDHVFTLSVPSLWRETPAPYGPLFLWIGRGISALTGENIVAAVLFHRLVVLIGVGLIVWATPRLAHRCGVAEVTALWLGAANPLLLMHLVAGIHNEALMLGLMLTGTEIALRGISGPAPRVPRFAGRWHHWAPSALVITGAVLITMSSQVKLPGLLALGFTAMALAHRWGGTFRAFLKAGLLMGSVALVVMAAIGWASGLGFGWLFTLGTANVVRSWMSPPTLLALGTGQVGILLGLGDHTTAVLSLTRAIGVLIITAVVSWLLLAVLRGRLHPVGGLGVALGATVLLFPVVQPWYLLWAIIPLAAWATLPRFRIAVVGVTLIVGIFGPTANGDRFALFQIVDATLASTLIAVAMIGLTLNRLPWRYVPGTDERYSGEEPDPPATPPAADAYAETP